jgi:integrase
VTLDPRVVRHLAHADALSEMAYAPTTERAYRTDCKHWNRYAASVGFRTPYMPITVEQLRSYIAAMDSEEGLSVATIRRRCSALARLHRDNGFESPTKDPLITKLLKSLARQRRVAPNKKRHATADIVIGAVLNPKTSVRDRAILLFGICTAMRRGEIVAVKWNELRQRPDGFEVRISHSKTDKEGKGDEIALQRIDDAPECCPYRALLAWKEQSNGKPSGLVFPICDRTVADVVKRAAKLAGLDPSEFGAHSLRSGFATTASEAGTPMELWMKHTRHRSQQVASGYARVANAFQNPGVLAMSDALRKASQKRRL